MSKITVISDIDGILRQEKKDIEPAIKEQIKNFCKSGDNRLVAITGAPLSHVPLILLNYCERVYAEHGGVCRREGDIHCSPPVALTDLMKRLGIKTANGREEISEGIVIIEGERRTGVTILFGSAPHYPEIITTADFTAILNKIQNIVQAEKLPLFIYHGASDGYRWVDVASTTKAITIGNLIGSGKYHKSFYLGDGDNDYEVMSSCDVIPVGFSNSNHSIQAIARQKGIFINEHAVKGGAAEFFERAINGELN